MSLSPEEQKELEMLEKEVGSSDSLSMEEQAELTQLEGELGTKPEPSVEKEFDYCFVSNIEIYGRDYCYIDIYYLVDNGGKILVTEVGYDFNV